MHANVANLAVEQQPEVLSRQPLQRRGWQHLKHPVGSAPGGGIYQKYICEGSNIQTLKK